MTGTSRYKSTFKSFASHASSKTLRCSSVCKKIIATANCFGRSTPRACASFFINDVGMEKSNPLPSPLLPSAAIAPLCIIRSNAQMASSTVSWVGTFLTFAIKPKPQLSLNPLIRSIAQAFCGIIHQNLTNFKLKSTDITQISLIFQLNAILRGLNDFTYLNYY